MSTRNKDMENHTEKFQPMQTTLAFQISGNKCEKALNDLSPSINSENCLQDDPPTTDEGNNNGLLQGTLRGGNYSQEKTYSRENRIPKSKFKTIKLSTSHSSKKKKKKISMNESTVSSVSSSDEEVLQTRFSVKKKNAFEADESCRSGKNSILQVTSSGKGSIKENYLNVKTPPIIIHATAYEGRNEPNNPNDMKKMTVTKQKEENNNKNETNMEITSIDSISVEANYSNTEKESDSIEILNDNRKECHDSKDYLVKKSNHDISLKQLMKNITAITEQDSIAIEFKKSKVGSDNLDEDFFNSPLPISIHQAEKKPSITNFKKSMLQQDLKNTELQKPKPASADIIEDFLNGSFDISAYQSEEPSVKKLKKSLHSNIAQFEKKSILMQTNDKNVQKRKKYDKREINELSTTNKKHKKNYSYSSEGGLFQNSPEILSSMNKKKSTIRQTKQTKTLQREVKKGRKQSIKKKSEQQGKFQLKGSSKAKVKNTTQQRNKTKDTSFNREEQDLTNNKLIDSSSKASYVKRNTSQKKCMDNSITTETPKSSRLTKYSTRKVRNSSLIASKKIKEIEKLENVLDFHEEIMIDSDEEVNYTSTPYSFKKFANYFPTGKACTNKIKAKNENNMLNNDKNKLRAEHAVEEYFDSEDTSQYYSRQDEINFGPTRYNITHSENLSSSSFKEIYPKKSSSLIDKHSMQEKNKNSGEILQNSFTSRKYNATDSKSAVDSFHMVNKKELTNNTNSYTFNKATKRKPRTWEMLERDLMNELDELPLTENVSKSFILKEEEVVREKKIINDTNLFTVTNTSMMKTISTSKTGNQYNMQYEIKNTESKFLESKVGTSHNLQKKFDIPHSKEILPSNSQNKKILDRAISAMEKCTRKFFLREAEICDYVQNDGGFQFEDISDNSDVNHETQFHSSLTFMANDNKQCFSNRTVRYLKKSGRQREKNINFEQKSNVVNALSNFRDQQGKVDHENSKNTEHAKQYISGSRNYLLEDHSEKKIHNKKNHAVVPVPEDKQIDRWSRLMNKLDLEADYEKYKNACSVSYPLNRSVTDENVKEQHSKSQMINSDMRSSSTNAKRNDKKFIQIDFKAKETKFDEKTQNKQRDHLKIPNNTAQSFISHTCESKNINSEERQMSYETQLKNNNEHENVGKDDKNVKNSRLGKSLKELEDETKITEKQMLRKFEKKTAKQSPKYNLKIYRDGTLKIKANRSLSASNSSKDFTKSPKITLNDSESNNCSSYKTNKSKNKYRRYLQRINDKIENNKTDDKNEPNELQSKVITEKNPNQGKNNQITRIKLIAENEDDIFSLSSSDSETGEEKTPGLGLLCDLFDE